MGGSTGVSLESSGALAMTEAGRSQGFSHAGLVPLIGLPLSVLGATTLALLFAFFPGGPIACALLGEPDGYGLDYTSGWALNQALLVQAACLAFAFLLLGMAFGRTIEGSRIQWTLWAANPITIGAGCVLFKLLHDGLPEHLLSVEYSHVRNGLLLVLLAPFLFAYCSRMGAYVTSRRRT